ncbi:MAG: T9SS type A sorting domain-containing protein [Phycisphaerales bacterium]|nr:T9SS type A sorting domain-containing protein [Phycisphaerales bacterium]
MCFGSVRAQSGAGGSQGIYINANNYINYQGASGGDVDIDVSGYLEIGSNGVYDVYGAIHNKGVIEVDSAGQLTIYGDMLNEAQLIVHKGAVINFYGKTWENTASASIIDGASMNTIPGGDLSFISSRPSIPSAWLNCSPWLAAYGDGNSFQNLDGADVPMDVVLHLKNTNNVLLINTPTRIEGQMQWDVANGNIDLGNHDLVFSQNASQDGYQSDRFAITSGSGYVVKENYTGNWIFPVGIADNDYTPAAINNFTANTMHVMVKNYTASTSTENAPYTVDDGVDRTWNVYANVAVGVSSVTLQHNTATNRTVFSEAYNFITRWGDINQNTTGDSISSTAWQKNKGVASSIGNLNATLTPIAGSSTNTRTYNNFATSPTDSISYFTKSTFAFQPAPIVLQLFETDTANCAVTIKFKSTKEINIKKFQLQHSVDSVVYTTIATIDPKGDNSEYQYWDSSPVTGKNYYRLLYVDSAGNYSLSKNITALVICDDDNPIVLYPNPAKANITLTGLSSPSEIRILNLIGRVELGFTANNPTENYDISMLPRATYLVWIIDSKQRITGIKFVKI